MRKKFTMLLASLFLVIGSAWAQTSYEVTATTGTGVGSEWTKEWTYTTSDANPVGLKLKCNYNNMQASDGLLTLYVGQHSSSTYTLEVPTLYKIVGYSFDFVKANDYTETVTLTVGGTAYNPTDNSQKVEVNNVNASSTTFTMAGANKGIKVSNFVVKIAANLPVSASAVGERKSTFKVGDEMYIYSTCRVNGNADYTGFFTNNNNGASLIKEKPANLMTFDNNAIWVIASLETLQTTPAAEGETAKTYYKVTLKNKATDGYLGIGGATNNTSVGDNQTFYISQWNDAVLTHGGNKVGTDVWSEDVNGTPLQQSSITNDAPIWIVEAGNGKCFNTENRQYQGNKPGGYPIVFYTVESADEKLAGQILKTNAAIASAESLFTMSTPVALQVTDQNAAGYIKCSNLDSGEGNNMNWLLDNNPETYIHSSWHSVSSSNDYLEVYLGEGNGMSLFYFTEYARLNVANDYPSTIEIQGSADGVTYNPVATVTGLPQSGKSYTSPLIECDPSYVYLRFVVTTGTNRIYFHMAEFDLYKVTTISEEQTRRWDVYRALSNAVQEGNFAVQKYNYSSMVSYCNSIEELKANATMTYPFTVTADVENPVLYAIKTGRTDNGKGWWYTYDEEDGKIALTQFTMANTQYWYFKEVVKNAKPYLELYPYSGDGTAMSYAGTNSAAGTIMAASKQSGNYNTLWQLEIQNGKYGLQTENKENRLSNNAGVSNKMGMWNAGPSEDTGTAMYLFEKPQYSFDLTTDDENPNLYAIRNHRGQTSWFTYLTTGDDAGKIALQAYTGADAQLWYFKEVASDKNAHGLQLYPYLGEGKVMSYPNENSAANCIIAKAVDNTDGYKGTWILKDGNNNSFGLQTEGLNNYLSHNGGDNNKMGLWHSGMSDSGTPLYISDPAEILQALIDEADEILGNVGKVGYHSEAGLEGLKTQTETSKTGLANKTSYSLSELQAAIAALSSEGVSYPTSGKYYQIKSAFAGFYNKQGKEMAIYSVDNGNLSWKALDNYNASFYWLLTPTDDDKYVIKNANGQYVCGLDAENDRYLMSAAESSAGKFTLTWVAPGQFKINGNGTMHTKGHNEGAGTDDRICSWDNNAAQSVWTFEEFTAEEYTVVEALIALKGVYEAKKHYSTEIVFGGLYGEGIGKYSGTDEYDIVEAFRAVDELWEMDFREQLNNVGSDVVVEHKDRLDGLTLTINQPTTGKYYRIKSMNGNDPARKGKYVQSTAEGDGLVLSTEKNANSIVYYDGNTFLSYASGLYLNGYQVNNNSGVISEIGATPNTWTIEENADIPGTYALSSTLYGWHMSDWTGNVTTYGYNDANAAWIFEEVVSLPVAVTAAGYSTFYTPEDMEIPTGVTANIIKTVSANEATLVPVTGIVPAGTGLILEANEGSYEFKIVTGAANADVEGNLLVGTKLKTLVKAEDDFCYYALGNKGGKVALYKAALNKNADGSAATENGTHFINNANKAYLPIKITSEAFAPAMFSFGRGGEDIEGGTTGIDNVELEGETVIYDLTGRRIEKIVEKGIYIVNGKKVVIK